MIREEWYFDLGFFRVTGWLLSAESVRTRNKLFISSDEPPFRGLKSSTKSSLHLLCSSENYPSYLNLSSLESTLISTTISVKVFWTISSTKCSFWRWGNQHWLQYSNSGLTLALINSFLFPSSPRACLYSCFYMLASTCLTISQLLKYRLS